ncbi:MAG: hypothetical protein SNI81_07955 [Rikenellaceae bacterium]
METNRNNTQTYWQRIDALRKEITAEIIQTITDHNLTEVEIYDEEGDNVSVMWFDRHDDIYDTAVKVVKVKDGELVLVAECSDCDDEDTEINNYDFAQRNISWLAEILDHVNAALTSKSEDDGE